MTNVFYRDVAKRYPKAVRGNGVYLYDADGKRYLDGSAGALVAAVGHGRREIADAAAAAISTLGFAHTSQFTTEAQEQLAARVAAMAPQGLEHVYLVSGGSEANETALKMAYQYHQRRGQRAKEIVISRSPSYHGNTLGALSASGHRSRRAAMAPLADAWVQVPAPACAEHGCRYVPSCSACGAGWADAVEQAILRAGPQRVSAFIAEPVTGSSCAAYVAPEPFFARMRQICDRHDVLFIADEVMCGMARTGTNFAIEQHGVAPDILTTAKGLGAGYVPLGAAIVSHGVYEAFSTTRTFTHGFTYCGSSIAAAIGNAVLSIFERESLCERARQHGIYLRHGLEQLARSHPLIGEVRGVGLMQGLELVADREHAVSFDPSVKITARAVEIAFAHGLILYPAGTGATERHRDQLLIGPPLSIERAEIDELLSLLDAALSTLEADVSSAR
ncbi:aminotransferase class III-fold pyridoxal phosphate-dependent enzyme [bacterium]|nr:MAG: aminotransferase class III-fold pyridoxal phosphate-dependent enzyme [bacterium]